MDIKDLSKVQKDREAKLKNFVLAALIIQMILKKI